MRKKIPTLGGDLEKEKATDRPEEKERGGKKVFLAWGSVRRLKQQG